MGSETPSCDPPRPPDPFGLRDLLWEIAYHLIEAGALVICLIGRHRVGWGCRIIGWVNNRSEEWGTRIAAWEAWHDLYDKDGSDDSL